MRVVFAGSPAIAVPSFEFLAKEEEINLVGVLTNPDTPKGRHGTPQPTEVGAAAALSLTLQSTAQQAVAQQAVAQQAVAQQAVAQQAAVKKQAFQILKPVKLDALAREQVAALNPDLLISFAYGHFFGPKFLALFSLGGINIHPSLLPKYRGPTPIQAAILNRENVTGISIQRLAQEMDSGDIIAVEQLQLTGKETTSSLSEVAAKKAVNLLPQALKKIRAGEQGTAQDHNNASFCSLISKDDGIIDWKMSAVEIEAKIRAYNPWPLCRTIHNGRVLFILEARIHCKKTTGEPGYILGIDKQEGILVQTKEGVLAVTQLQYSGKKALFWQDFLNGVRDFSGSVLKQI